MIGESAKHRDILAKHLVADAELVALPREAAVSNAFDHEICRDDVLISLKYARPDSKPAAFNMLHVPGAGLDGIDFNAIPESAWVCNVFEHEIPIAEYVFAAILDNEVGYSKMHADFSAQHWPALYRSRVPHGEIHGKSIGVIGYGRIGKEIAKRAKAFGMKVLVATRHRPETAFEYVDELHLMNGLDAVLVAADYLVIACPLSESTRGLINQQALAKMNDQAVLINVSRAEIIDQKALYEALSNRTIGGAILDVWWHYPKSDSDQPEPADYPFASMPNVRSTAHSSAWTKYLPERRYRLIAQNINNMIKGEPLINIVQRPKRL